MPNGAGDVVLQAYNHCLRVDVAACVRHTQRRQAIFGRRDLQPE